MTAKVERIDYTCELVDPMSEEIAEKLELEQEDRDLCLRLCEYVIHKWTKEAIKKSGYSNSIALNIFYRTMAEKRAPVQGMIVAILEQMKRLTQ